MATITMNIYTIALAIPLLLASVALSAQTVTGKVYYTQTSKRGIAKETPLSEVMVTDGTSITTTRSDGSFELATSPQSTYIAITTPDGYTTSRFFQPVSSETLSYQFPLSKSDRNKSKATRFIIVNDAVSSPDIAWVGNLKQQAFYSDAKFIVNTGKHTLESSSIIEKELAIPVYSTVSSQSVPPLLPSYYSFVRGGIHFVALSAASNNQQHPIRWLREALATVGRTTPTILINGSTVKNNDSETLSASGDTLRLADYNIKAIIDGHTNINLYDYRGKEVTSTIYTAPPTSGGIDHSPEGFRLVSINKKGEITTETALTNVASMATLVSPGDTAYIEDGKLRFYANVYSSQSPVSRVRVGVSKDSVSYKWCELNKASAWTWSGFYVITPTDSVDKYYTKLEAFAKSGDITTSEKTVTISTAITDSTLIAKENLAKHQGYANNYTSFTGTISQMWTANPQGSILFSSPVVIDSIVVIPSTNDLAFTKSEIVAFDIKTGKSIWHFFPKGIIKNTFTVEGANFIATDIFGNVYSISSQTGIPNWQSVLDKEKRPDHFTAGAFYDSLYIYGSNSSITALHCKDGAVAWSLNHLSILNACESALTVGNGIILALNHEGCFVGIDARTGKTAWSTTYNGSLYSGFCVSFSNGLFHVISGNKYVSIDPKNGSVTKAATLPATISTKSTPLQSDSKLIYGTTNNGMVAYDLQSGKTAWSVEVGTALVNTLPNTQERQKTVETAPVKVGRFIVFGASDGFLYVVDIANGMVKQKVNLGAPILSTPAIAGGNLYITDLSGNISVFKLL